MKTMQPWIRAMLFGLVSFALTLGIVAIFAKLIEGGSLSMGAMSLLRYAIIAMSVFSGCIIVSLSAKTMRLTQCLLTGGCYFLLLCIVHGVLQHGAYDQLLPSAGIVLGAALLAAIAGAGKRVKHAY